MILAKERTDNTEVDIPIGLTASQKRRLRRKKLQTALAVGLESIHSLDSPLNTGQNKSKTNVPLKKPVNCVIKESLHHNKLQNEQEVNSEKTHPKKHRLNINLPETENLYERKENNCHLEKVSQEENRGNSRHSELSKVESMSTKEAGSKSREEVLAAREAKKRSKQKVKQKVNAEGVEVTMSQEDDKKEDFNEKIKLNESSLHESAKSQPTTEFSDNNVPNIVKQEAVESKQAVLASTENPQALPKPQSKIVETPKSKDEVDRAVKLETGVDNDRDKVKAERAAKKAAKQAKKQGVDEAEDKVKDLTVKDVVETLRDIVIVAKEMKDVTAKVSAINLESKKSEESKSKAELRAERRAKQEAQRAAKQVAQQEKVAAKPNPEHVKPAEVIKEKEKTPTKSKLLDKPKVKSQGRVNWFQHLYTDHDKESLKKIAINSNLHPAIIKLGAQLASRVVTGSNARCVALLNALKQMVRDYTLPAKTEFGRGLDSHLAASLDFLWAMRQPSASQTNAVKFFRHHLTQLPNNVDEFDAKKTLQEEIDRYIREQIDMAGEAISIAVRNKISNGDNILTYGCSSLIERILREAWAAGVRFRAVVVGNRVQNGGREMLRRLVAAGLPCSYIDITAVSFIMNTIHKVVLGASSLLVDGSVLGAVGTAQVALLARARNVPVLVACETHKFCGRVQTDAFVYNEIGDPDDLIDKSDENSPLKDWRSNPNLTPLNLTYDVTPPSLVTAVITELAILPCTSAPVVLRFKLSEYGI